METVLSQRVLGLTPSVTFEISARAAQMRAERKQIISFAIGEPDFGTPLYICNAAKTAIDQGRTKYTATAGILELREAICAKLLKQNGLKYRPEQIVVSNGAKQALFNALMALIDPGDEVIIPAPYWLTYVEIVKLCGGIGVFTDGIENIPQYITGKTKAVIINSPNNPTGEVIEETRLIELAKTLQTTNIWVISDEIYEQLVYDGAVHVSIAKFHEKTVVINGLSKSYAMTGWRIGYTATSSMELSNAMAGLQSHCTSGIITPAQFAALEALTNPVGDKTVTWMIQTFDQRRKYMIERLEKMPGLEFIKPQGAFYVMIKVNATAEDLLEHAEIATVPGDAFGAPGFIRLSYTVSKEDLKTGLDRLEQYLKSLAKK